MPYRPWWAMAPHGTDAGYQRCKKRPQGACQSCKDAHARDMQARREMLRRAGWTHSKELNKYVPPEAGHAA